MNIAVFSAQGDSQDYEVNDDSLKRLLDSKQIWKGSLDTDTGGHYSEEEPREMYSCDYLPMESDGVRMLSESE